MALKKPPSVASLRLDGGPFFIMCHTPASSSTAPLEFQLIISKWITVKRLAASQHPRLMNIINQSIVG